MQKKINNIAITGGTHGNELTGVYLVKKFKSNPELVKRDSFETVLMHTNKKAIKECRRYIDRDLNRAFDLKDLNDPDKYLYEDVAAKLINRELGPKGSDNPKVDFIIDLHTTTSNMGLSLVVDDDSEISWQAAAYLKSVEPEVNIFRWLGDKNDASFVNSIAGSGFAVEVGAIPQGVLREDLFFQTEKLITHLLDFFDKYNKGELKNRHNEVEIYDFADLLDYPRDENGDIAAMVDDRLQGNDYILLKKGDPVFVTLDGKRVLYDRDEELYALFINEAAYYEKGFAMCLAEKKTIKI